MAKELFVGKGKQYKTIGDAIKASSEKDTINVASGVYHEDFVVNKDITIVGEDGTYVVPSKDGCCKITGSVYIKNVVFKKNKTFLYKEWEELYNQSSISKYEKKFDARTKLLDENKNCCVEVTKGGVLFRNCVFENCDADGVICKGSLVGFDICIFSGIGLRAVKSAEKSDAAFSNCTFNDNFVHAAAYDKSRVTFTECKFSTSVSNAIILCNESFSSLENVLCQNADDMILLKDNSNISIKECNIENCYYGLYLRDNSFAEIKKCNFKDEKKYMKCIIACDQSHLAIEDCDFTDCSSAIEFSSESKNNIVRNCKFKNLDEGIFLGRDLSKVKVFNCTMSHVKIGFSLSGASKLIADLCNIKFSEYAVGLTESAKADLQRFVIERCSKNAIDLDESAYLKITDSNIHNNKGSGIYTNQKSKAEINYCKIFENNFMGVSCIENSKASLLGTEVYDNKVCNTAARDYALVKTTECKIKENKGPENKLLTMWKVSIRPLEYNQMKKYRKIIAGGFGQDYDTDFYDTADTEYYLYQTKDAVTFLAWIEKEAVGTIQVNLIRGPYGPCFGYVTSFCVLPEYRRKGIGTRLMDEVKEYCAQNYISILELSSKNIPERKAARLFYKHLGFDCNSDTHFMWRG